MKNIYETVKYKNKHILVDLKDNDICLQCDGMMQGGSCDDLQDLIYALDSIVARANGMEGIRNKNNQGKV